MGRVATFDLGPDIVFGLRLEHLVPGQVLDRDTVTRDAVALVTALDGHRNARFVLQHLCLPDIEYPELGRMQIHLLAALSANGDVDRQDLVDEVCDDLCDVLAAPPVRWSFEPIESDDDLAAALGPFEPKFFAEVARREEPCTPTAWRTEAGYGSNPGSRVFDRDLWSTWTFGPASSNIRRVAAVMLLQEAPVAIRAVLAPTGLNSGERQGIEDLLMAVGPTLPNEGLLRSSLHTLESLLYVRPLFDVRVLVSSSAPISRSLLSTIGHAVSEPADHAAPQPVLRGGFATLVGDEDVDAKVLADAYSTLAPGEPVPSLASEGLERVRRLLGAWEAANVFRIPVGDDDGYPGLHVLDIPELEPPLGRLARSGHRLGHVAGQTRTPVYVEPEDRFRHLYVSGQTGTGKSTLLLNLAMRDISSGTGVAVIDPHGDLVEFILERIPEDRVDDVVLVDPSDPVAVVGVNLLEAESAVQADYLVEELAAMFYALFDPERQGIVGPRFETMLRQAANLLMAQNGVDASMLDIVTVFTDEAVRNSLVRDVTDPILAEFWLGEMRMPRSNEWQEVMSWFRSKFEIFRTSRLVRNVVGQGRSTVSFADVLAQDRILLVNLSKGLLGEYNSALIGHIVFARLWSAALERASKPHQERRDFHVYIDEFQNVTSDSLPTVLSESRKYRIGLTLANQFFTQVPEQTRDAIMGNVGSRVTFRVGPKDGYLFSNWFGEDVRAENLTRLPNYVAVAGLSSQGVPLAPFVLRTDAPTPDGTPERAEQVRVASRRQWARRIEELDDEFFGRWQHVPGSISARVAGGLDAAETQRPFGGARARPQEAAGGFLDSWLAKRGTPADSPLQVEAQEDEDNDEGDDDDG